MMNPKISIVTVTYNAAESVAQTIESVLAQDYRDYEYVFMDGASKDATVTCIESYRSAFEAKGIRCTVQSEPDKGIYDAMNKGIRRANGSWVLMLNAGDRLVDPKVLSDLMAQADEQTQILYGNAVLCEAGRYKLSMALPLETITTGMPVNHQCVLVRRELMEQYGFDTKYRIAADYHQLLRCYLDGKTFRYVHRLISVYDVSGFSERNFAAMQREQRAIRESFGLTGGWPLGYVLARRGVARLIGVLFPKWSRSEKRGWYADKDQILLPRR